jgi:hypothetical protein
MKLLLNLLKAFCIVIGLYFLLYVGFAILAQFLFRVPISNYRLPDFSLSFSPDGGLTISGSHYPSPSIAVFVSPIFLAFGALYLPRKGRLFAAIAALSLVLGNLALAGILFWNG